MHIPDGFIDPKTAVVAGALAAAGVSLALRRVRQEFPSQRVPLLGLSAAFLFAAQMLNFPIIGGTSGHLIGGALIAVLLGPAAATVVVTCVLIVQCVLFADGGVLALGANVFNMALVAPYSGYWVSRLVRRIQPDLRGKVTAMAFAGWCSTVCAALGCAAQLAWSGTVGWSVALPAMVGVHMLIGLGEGLISALVLLAVLRTRPEIVLTEQRDMSPNSLRWSLGMGIVLALGLAVFVAPFACPWPDGLEAVAAKLGFAQRAEPHLLPAPVADYMLPGLDSPGLATAAAGAIGVLVVFGLALMLSRLLVRNPAAGMEAADRA